MGLGTRLDYPQAATTLHTTTASTCYLFTQHLHFILQRGSYIPHTMWNHPFAPPCYKMQGFDVSVHAMLEYMQQVGITNEMPAPYKLACAHWLQTHWHRQAGIDSLTAACWSREARRRQAFLLIVNCQPGGACLWDLQHEAHEGMRRPTTKWSKSCRPTGWHISAIDPKLFSSPINLALTNGSNHWILRQLTRSRKTLIHGQRTEVLFAATSDRLPSHPAKKLESHRQLFRPYWGSSVWRTDG